MRTLRQRVQRPSPSMVVALLALFVALGGSAFAAGYVITKSSQIKNGVITGADVKNSSLTGADLKNGSVSAKDIKPGEIIGAVGPQGAPGPQGTPGAQGDKGDTGPAGAIATYSKTVATGGSLASSIPPATLFSLGLPAGNWAIVTHVRVSNDSSAEYTASCELNAGSTIDRLSAVESVSTQGQQTSSQVLPMMGVAALPNGGTVAVACSDSLTQPAKWDSGKIVAIQVSTIG